MLLITLCRTRSLLNKCVNAGIRDETPSIKRFRIQTTIIVVLPNVRCIRPVRRGRGVHRTYTKSVSHFNARHISSHWARAAKQNWLLWSWFSLLNWQIRSCLIWRKMQNKCWIYGTRDRVNCCVCCRWIRKFHFSSMVRCSLEIHMSILYEVFYYLSNECTIFEHATQHGSLSHCLTALVETYENKTNCTP